MDYAFLILLIIILIVSVFSLFKNINESNITERLGKLETDMVREMGTFRMALTRDLSYDFDTLNAKLEKKIDDIDKKVNEKIDDNFKKTNQTFNSLLERLAKIDEAQKKIDSLSNDIISLQSVLTDKKSRGIFGEVNLKNIMSNVFGENNDKIYKMQYSFSNGTIADCVLFAPSPMGVIAIDSKFPLENYQIMVDKSNSSEVRENAEKNFKSDFKKHIDAIASKYIIDGVTSDQAILFLPAEAIFAEVNAYHRDILEYAYKKRVWITSPTTLISTLTTIQVLINNMERDKYASVIQKELKCLSDEFSRYRERWDKLSRSIDSVNKDVKDIHITTEKITKRFDSINSVSFDDDKKNIE